MERFKKNISIELDLVYTGKNDDGYLSDDQQESNLLLQPLM